jgi:drug/metabolite transporter (DMT)-like permease
MAGPGSPRQAAWLCLGLYILLRGSDSTVLKWLQQQGSAVQAGLPEGGGDPISVCNVFFFSSLISGVVVLWLDRAALRSQLPRLRSTDRLLLALQGSLGFLIGPTAFYLALEHLSVISQTLLFSLILPATALLARWLLAEPWPARFAATLILLLAGLLLARGAMAMDPAMGSPLTPQGVGWALLSVLAFALGGILNRQVAARGWGPGLTVGIGSLGAAIVFAITALLLFGPEHFIFLRLWWVLGVIGLYGVVLSLGSQLALMGSYRGLSATRISLWGALTIPVALLLAHLLLGEPLPGRTIAGMGLIVAALLISGSAGGPAEAR